MLGVASSAPECSDFGFSGFPRWFLRQRARNLQCAATFVIEKVTKAPMVLACNSRQFLGRGDIVSSNCRNQFRDPSLDCLGQRIAQGLDIRIGFGELLQ